jgi:hypothetical protein
MRGGRRDRGRHPGAEPVAHAPSASASCADLTGEAALCSTAALRSAISSDVRMSSVSSRRLRRRARQRLEPACSLHNGTKHASRHGMRIGGQHVIVFQHSWRLGGLYGYNTAAL